MLNLAVFAKEARNDFIQVENSTVSSIRSLTLSSDSVRCQHRHMLNIWDRVYLVEKPDKSVYLQMPTWQIYFSKKMPDFQQTSLLKGLRSRHQKKYFNTGATLTSRFARQIKTLDLSLAVREKRRATRRLVDGVRKTVNRSATCPVGNAKKITQ